MCKLFFLCAMSVIGQNLSSDSEKLVYPKFKINSLDSIHLVNVYKGERSYQYAPKLPKKADKLIYTVKFDDKKRESEIMEYDPYDISKSKKYAFEYDSIGKTLVRQLDTRNNILHVWVLSEYGLTEQLGYNCNGKLENQWEYTIENDSVIKEIKKLDNKENVEYKILFEYNGENQMIERREYEGENVVSINKRVYKEGKLVRVFFYPEKYWVIGTHLLNKKAERKFKNTNESEIPYSFVDIEYNSKDEIIKRSFFTPDSVLDYYVKYKYVDGKIQRVETFNAKEKLTGAVEIVYNEFGGEMSFKRFKGKSSRVIFERNSTVDEKGNVKKVETFNYTHQTSELFIYKYE